MSSLCELCALPDRYGEMVVHALTPKDTIRIHVTCLTAAIILLKRLR